MAANIAALPYRLRYANGTREVRLNWGADNPIKVMGLPSFFGTVEYDITTAKSPDGEHAIVNGVQYGGEQVYDIQIAIYLPDTSDLRVFEVARELNDAFGPKLPDGRPNRGYLYLDLLDLMPQPEVWRGPVRTMSVSFPKPAGERLENHIITDLRFGRLDHWEADPGVSRVLKLAGDATWLTHAWSEVPGGNEAADPEWELDGPATGTIETLTIVNQTTGQSLTLAGLALASGQTLRITTGYAQKAITINGVSMFHTVQQYAPLWSLLPGDNSIVVTKDVTSQSALRLVYRPRRSGMP